MLINRANLSSAKRIVIKIGSSTLTHKTGKLNFSKMVRLFAYILQALTIKVIFISNLIFAQPGNHRFGIVGAVFLALSPGVERRGEWRHTFVPNLVDAGGDLTKGEEVIAATLLECRNKVAVEHQAVNVLDGIDTEGINAEVDVVAVGIDQILLHLGIFGVQIRQVFMDGALLGGDIFPVFQPADPSSIQNRSLADRHQRRALPHPPGYWYGRTIPR